MRILHAADLHLGLQTHSWPDPTTGIPSRVLDVGRAWGAACQLASERQVDAVIVAGDVFHGRNPDAVSLNLFAKGLRSLWPIPVLVIAGNHDGAVGPNRPCVLDVFRSERVQVSTRPEIRELATGVKVATLPWVSRQQLMAANADLSRTAAVAATTEALQRIIDAHRGEGADVLVGHWSIQGSVLGNERDIAIVGDGEVMIAQADLEGPWSYGAFGHIHGKQIGGVGSSTWAYSGSIDRMNFGEEDESKGVYLVDVDGGATEFVELPARRFMTIDGLVGMARDVEEAIVRVRLRVSADEAASIDRAQIERGLLEAGAALVYVQIDVERAERARSQTLRGGLGLHDAVAEWIRLRGIDVDEADELRRMVAELETPHAGAVVDGAHAGVANAGDAGSSPAPRSEQVAS